MTLSLMAINFVPAFGLDNGLAITPPMGYNSWYDVGCALSENKMMQVANRMIELGLDKLGYRYLNLDDCWARGRREDGTLFADNVTFPSGDLKTLASYVHGKGLLFGTYTDRGSKTCAKRPGALNFEELDAQTYAAWGVDYLKEDSCFASQDHNTAFQQYAKMRDALNNTGRSILFSMCGWNQWYAPVGASLGNAFRIGPDDQNWHNVLKNLDNLAQYDLHKYAGPGAWNDPCLLLSRGEGGRNRVSETQSRAQFSMWAVIAAPLMISGSLLKMSNYTLNTYTNQAVIGVNQDPMGKPGWRISGDALTDGATNVWARPLVDGSHAMVFLNANKSDAAVTCNADCFASIGLFPGERLAVVDLWTGAQLPEIINASFSVMLAAMGGHMMIKVTPNFSVQV